MKISPFVDDDRTHAARFRRLRSSNTRAEHAADDSRFRKSASEQPSRCCVLTNVDERIETCGFASCANRLYLRRRGSSLGRRRRAATIHCESIVETTLDRYIQPTLRQAWPRECPRPQYAFKISMFNVSCNSHYFTQLAALFIDTRAE